LGIKKSHKVNQSSYTRYNPNYDYIKPRLLEGPLWKKVPGRNQKGLNPLEDKIFNDQIEENKNYKFYVLETEKSKCLVNMNKMTQRGEFTDIKDLRIRTDKPFIKPKKKKKIFDKHIKEEVKRNINNILKDKIKTNSNTRNLSLSNSKRLISRYNNTSTMFYELRSLLEKEIQNLSQNKIKDKNKSLTRHSKNYQKFSMDIKNYNKNIKEMLSNMSKTTNYFRKLNNHGNIDVHYKNKNVNKNIVKKYSNPPFSNMNSFINNSDNENKKLSRFSSFSNNINNPGLNLTAEINTKRKNSKVSNQIESIYNQLDKIQKTIRKYEKRNELDIKYLYSLYSHDHDPEKLFKQSNIQDEKLLKLDQELVHSVNSFNY
jgi:hypothetical protein